MSLQFKYHRIVTALSLLLGIALLTPAVVYGQDSTSSSSQLIALVKILLMVVAFIIAIVPHEVAHAVVAQKLGDPTARNLGRITLNPLAHVDPVMTILCPLILILSGAPFIFGGAKPVPVDPRYFNNPRRGMAIVAIAGPAINFAIATVSIILIPVVGFIYNLLHFPKIISTLSMEFLYVTALINLFLGAFNLLPIPPLDGGRIAVGFLPLPLARVWARLEPFGIPIVVLLLLGGVVDFIVKPVIFYLQFLVTLFV